MPRAITAATDLIKTFRAPVKPNLSQCIFKRKQKHTFEHCTKSLLVTSTCNLGLITMGTILFILCTQFKKAVDKPYTKGSVSHKQLKKDSLYYTTVSFKYMHPISITLSVRNLCSTRTGL